MSKRENKKREQRAALIKHAWLCFAARGFDDTQVIDIARSADVAHGTLYRHFESKEDLFNTVCEAMVDEIERALPAASHIERLTREALDALTKAGYFPPGPAHAARLRDVLESRASPLIGERGARLWRAMLLEVALEDDDAFCALIASAFEVNASAPPAEVPVVKNARAAGWR